MPPIKKFIKPTSFISERSAEYVLIPKLAEILEPYFSKVIPLYFASTREGSKMGLSNNPLQHVRIILVYARRPKIVSSHEVSIEVKFNSSLFSIAATAKSVGIPTFAGVPLASSIFDLTPEVNCKWFELSKMTDEDMFYQLSFNGEVLCQSKESHNFINVLDEKEIPKVFLKSSQTIEWFKAVENLKFIRRSLTNTSNFSFWNSYYRPFQLVLLD